MEALLERFGMSSCNSKGPRTPLPSSFKPSVASDKEFEQAKHLDFPQIAGSVLYLSTITQPDISYAAGVLARYISKWGNRHYDAAKHLLRYLRGTSDLCLSYDGEAGKRLLLGYADADWGGCADTQRSTTGYLYKTWGSITSWRSRRQPTVSLSTAQAEYMALSNAAQQALWLRLLLEDIGFAQEGPTKILNDNMGAIHLSKNAAHHQSSKHISLRSAMLREQVKAKNIDLSHVSSKENQADMFTKSLTADQFETLKEGIGMKHHPLKPV